MDKVSSGLDVGTRAPGVATKTLVDVDNDLSKLTITANLIHVCTNTRGLKALQSGKPIVLEFATPGHCTNCDEQFTNAQSDAG